MAKVECGPSVHVSSSLRLTSLQAEFGTVRLRTAIAANVPRAGALRHRETAPVSIPVRSHMVALGEASVLPGTLTAADSTPFMARTTIPPSHRFPIPTWAPRSGRGMSFHKWWSAVRKLLAAYGLPPDSVDEEPPSEHCVSSEVAAGPASPSSYEEWAPEGGRRLTVVERDAWVAVNTSLYWHLHPSVDIEGAHFLQDDRMLESFVSGRMADGRGLLRKLLTFVDASGTDLQRALNRKLAECRMKAEGASRSALNRHCEVIKQIWELIAGNDLDDPASLLTFWEDLAASLPTEPSDAKLVGVRTWLRTRCVRG